jgi:hypothetical protein
VRGRAATGRAPMKPHRSARSQLASGLDPSIDRYRLQHLSVVEGVGPDVGAGAKFDESESPLIWLARRKGTDGRPLIEPHHLQAGERLRCDFTLAQMMPRTTANWHAAVAGRHRGQTSGHLTDRVIAARQQLRHALNAAGPEFSGLLIDVCCFLKKLDIVERERRWPARSAKVVLLLALESLARHYGLRTEVRGSANVGIRSWTAEQPADAVADDG